MRQIISNEYEEEQKRWTLHDSSVGLSQAPRLWYRAQRILAGKHRRRALPGDSITECERLTKLPVQQYTSVAFV